MTQIDPFSADEILRRLEKNRADFNRLTQTHGWLCPKCGKAHAPSVLTCPERANSLGVRESYND